MRCRVRFGLPVIGLTLTVMMAACGPEPSSLFVPTPTRVFIPSPVPTTAPAEGAPTLVSAPTSLPTATVTPLSVPPTATTSSVGVPGTATKAPRTATIPAGTMRIKLFFVALEDNGKSGKKIGCNDSLVAVERAIPATDAPLTAALRELLSLRGRTYGQSGLYNALAQAQLNVDRVAVASGLATIHLTGSLSLGGVCDNPRAESQLKELALQFPTVKQVVIYLNGVPIEKALSGKGD